MKSELDNYRAYCVFARNFDPGYMRQADLLTWEGCYDGYRFDCVITSYQDDEVSPFPDCMKETNCELASLFFWQATWKIYWIN